MSRVVSEEEKLIKKEKKDIIKFVEQVAEEKYKILRNNDIDFQINEFRGRTNHVRFINFRNVIFEVSNHFNNKINDPSNIIAGKDDKKVCKNIGKLVSGLLSINNQSSIEEYRNLHNLASIINLNHFYQEEVE